ncbi:MAG TPA: type II CAAX endopeptidase family protein [Candidatus Limnocylindria bacterium]|jgi:membrane protease YdiL (CAAX protease family)|nr:type II CAAX endopeptidase family protein [Candidatus Limnocylindria bacterium]
MSSERVAVPFWGGLLSAFGAVTIGMVIATITGVLLLFATVLVTGHEPSTAAGHPLSAAFGLIFYAAVGAIALPALQRQHRAFFRLPTAHDVRTILLGIAALLAVHIATGIQLVLTHQTKHVQSGFEHFSVATRTPSLTLATTILTALTLVILAPIVEEMVFRGLLFGALSPRIGILAAALISALIFGLVHGDAVLFPTLAALGLINALTYAATGNLVVPISLHALNNALAAAALFSTLPT